MAPPTTTIAAHRTIGLTFTDPLVTYDSNAQLWLTATQLGGKLDDTFGIGMGLDQTMWYRLVSIGFAAASTLLWSHLSHELGHRQHDFDFHRTPGQILPDRPTLISDLSNVSDLIKGVADGFNQQEMNLALLDKTILRDESFSPDLATAYLMNRGFLLGYIVAFPQTITPTTDDAIWWDPPYYRGLLNMAGHTITPGTHAVWALAATALDGRLYDAIFSLMHYVRTGDRHFTPLHIVADGLRIFLPTLRLWHHSAGLLLDAELPIKELHGPLTARFNIATGVAGGLHLVRTGVAVDDIFFTEHWAAPILNAGLWTTVWPDRDRNFFGWSAELGLRWAFPGGIGVGGNLQFANNDPIVSDIQEIEAPQRGIPLQKSPDAGGRIPTLSYALTMHYAW